MELASLRKVFEFCSAQRAAWRSEAFLERRRNSSASATSGALARSIVTRWFLDRCHDAATDDLNSEESAPCSTNFSHAALTSRWSIPAPPTCRWPQLRSLTIEHPLRIFGRRGRRHQANATFDSLKWKIRIRANVSGACIMMTGDVGLTKQSIQRSLPRFFQRFSDAGNGQAYTRCQVAQSGSGRVSARERGDQAGHHQPRSRSDFGIVSAPPSRREPPNQRCPATIAEGEGAAQHAGRQRRSFVPRRPSRCSRAIARYYNPSASHQGLLDATRTSTRHQIKRQLRDGVDVRRHAPPIW